MTILCDKCGCENHLDANECQECGYPIKKDIEYVVCSICGLSNPKAASTCIGCSEPLSGSKSFSVDRTVRDSDESEHILSVESSGVVPKTEERVEPKKVNRKAILKYTKIGLLTIIAITILVMLTLFIMGDKVYLEVENAFYYINNTNELHIINDQNEDMLIYSGITTVDEINKYGDNIYFESEGVLYHHQNNKVVIISETINSYKVNLTGKKVLYTIGDVGMNQGDLYLYDGTESKRIDGKVGINRFIFSENNQDVYYVTDVTAEENLGVLYIKKDGDAPEKIADDVYEPLFSLKSNSVYFVRKNLNDDVKFELYYANKERVTEIGRNIQNVIFDYSSENILLIQEKNGITSLLQSKREDVSVFDTEISSIGRYTFNDVATPLLAVDGMAFIYQKNDQKTYYLVDQKKTLIEQPLNAFWLSKDGKQLYVTYEHELLKSSFKNGSISNTINLASGSEVLVLSESGELSVIKHESGEIVLVDNGVERTIEGSEDSIQFANNEKYMIYLQETDSYALKIGAQEPVYLGENIYDAFMIDKYVYTVSGDKLYRYKLGKFSSNKELTTLKKWGKLE